MNVQLETRPGTVTLLIVTHHIACNFFLSGSLGSCRCRPTYVVVPVDDENFESVALLIADDEGRSARMIEARRN